MENFDLKKFLVENKLTANSRLLNEVDQSVQIANNLKKIKSTTEAVLVNAKRALEDEETYAGIDREGTKNPQAVEQQIEVVQDILENIEDYAGDGWAVDIEDVAREKSIPELQMMLKRLIEETDNLQKELTGQPIQEGDLNEGWKQWALGALAGLSVLGGGTAQAATGANTGMNKPGIEASVQKGKSDIDKMSETEAYDAVTKAVEGMTPKEARKLIERLLPDSREDSTDQQMVLTFIKSIEQGSPMPGKNYIGSRLKMAKKYTQALIKKYQEQGISTAFMDIGSRTGPQKPGPITTPRGSVSIK